MHSSRNLTVVVMLLLLVAVGCTGGQAGGGANAAGGGRGGAMPAMGVELLTLQARPVEQMTEFIGAIKSRRSTNIQPQVEGFVTRIHVKSGDRVAAGTRLMEIDSRLQESQLRSLESIRAQREIDVAYARQEAERATKLLAAGAASQMDADRANNALKAAEAQSRTVEEQLRTSRTDIDYYRVTAPSAGVVGDIPVREGDRVTKSTLLTTIDANAGFEVYISVPVQQASKLKTGLTVRLVDEDGALTAEEHINFISPSVDTQTQTVLVKTPVTLPGNLRTDQYLRAQVIWSADPGLSIPLTSVTRVNGQWFAFVAEPGEGGKGLVARQRAVQLGPVVGNNYTVLGGLKPGEQLITAGIQKIRDGAPVTAVTAAAAPASPAGSR